MKMGKFLVKDTTTLGTNNIKTDEAPIDSVLSLDLPSDVIFPNQLSRYYKDHMNSLALENGALRRSLEEMQSELLQMKQKLARTTQTIPMGKAAEVADYKIIQLSKKLREQNAEMESLRTQAKEAETKLRRLEDKMSEQEIIPVASTPNALMEKDKQIKMLTDKLQASNARMCDFRNQYQALKQEMKLAQKVIESEIGEKVVLQDLAKENGNYRGRAQQILTLQNKVQQLQEQLNNSSSTENPSSSILRQMEKDRRANLEEITKQLNLKTIQMEDVRKKFEAAKARNKVLENEIIQVKMKLNATAEKGAKDEQLISTLTSQINAFEDRGKAQMQCFSKMQESMNKMQQEMDLERNKNELLQKALADRETRIHRMEDQIDEFRKTLRNNPDVIGNEDADKEKIDKSTDTLFPPGEIKTTTVSDMERTRLMELLAVINKRLDEARREQNEAESQLRKERYKNAKLETKIARLELEKVGAMKVRRGSYSQGSSKRDNSTDEVDLLAQQHIEYLEEECLALKTRIKTLQMEKEADFRVLVELDKTRITHADSHDNRKLLFEKELASPVEGVKKKSKLNRKRIHRSQDVSSKTGIIKQASSEYVEYYDRSPAVHRLSYQ